MKLSIIIPVFNDHAGLMRCLDGLRQQSYPYSKIQVIVVDNGSTPPVRIGRTYPFAVEVLRCDTPGSYAARNAGVAAARGEVFVFLDADCVPEYEWLCEGTNELVRGGSRCIVGGNVQLFPHERRTGTGLYQRLVGFQQKENIEVKKFSATANLFCYAEQFKDVGCFNEGLLSGGDREWAWRARQQGYRLAYASKAVVSTPPRTSLRDAVRQARRVAAGRRQLKEFGLAHLGDDFIRPHRTGFVALRWIWKRRELSMLERVRVIGAALIIRLASIAERLRLRLGAQPERR